MSEKSKVQLFLKIEELTKDKKQIKYYRIHRPISVIGRDVEAGGPRDEGFPASNTYL